MAVGPEKVERSALPYGSASFLHARHTRITFLMTSPGARLTYGAASTCAGGVVGPGFSVTVARR